MSPMLAYSERALSTEATAPKNTIRPDCSLQVHMGTKVLHFGQMSFCLMKQKINYLAIMAIVMSGGKRKRLVNPRTPS